VPEEIYEERIKSKEAELKQAEKQSSKLKREKEMKMCNKIISFLKKELNES